MMDAMHQALGDSPLMAYLAMMAVRLVELHRVLKPTGSLYLHCDPTASHYLKLVLDAVFGAENFRSEIIWRRTRAHNDRKITRFGAVHDTILFYAKSADRLFNVQYSKRDPNAPKSHDLYVHSDGETYRKDNCRAPGGRGPRYEWNGHTHNWRFSPEERDRLIAADRIVYSATGMPRILRPIDPERGSPLQDVWTDIDPLNSGSTELLGYPTQKPSTLLERIIAASSNPGDVVLDPFCGCGTAVDAAQKLGRQWIGIDVTHIAIGMIEDRMRSGYPGIAFETIGVPRDLASAERLAAEDPHQFQQWVCWQVGGFPRDKKGGDKGVDGWFNYLAKDGRIRTGVISVKAGDNVNPNMVRDLGRVMERDRHEFGLFVMKGLPTKGMRDEAASHPMIEMKLGGIDQTPQRFPALQFVTLAELMMGMKPKLPPLISPVKKASRVETRASHQKGAQGALL
jgi:site-specific DNA-methyltransferase (adenine-specific)